MNLQLFAQEGQKALRRRQRPEKRAGCFSRELTSALILLTALFILKMFGLWNY